MLSTGGNLVFAGDSSGNLVALNATTGDPLWRSNLGSLLSNGPITYDLDGDQYLIAGAGDTLFGFVMYQKTAHD
jgi:alcohol dehydrogenase (cytochrome c)